jgi:hypothetical protein
VEMEFGVPIPGRIWPESKWTRTGIKLIGRAWHPERPRVIGMAAWDPNSEARVADVWAARRRRIIGGNRARYACVRRNTAASGQLRARCPYTC